MKLVEVMACVDRISKNGNNEAQHYKYAMASDVYDAVRGELAKRFILLVPRVDACEFTDKQTKSGGTMTYCLWKGSFDFLDAETGEVLNVKALGTGSDMGDKALYKAVTGATKAVCVQTFLIPTGDDPENEKAAAKAPPPAGAEALKSRMKEAASSGPAPLHDRSLIYPFGNSKGMRLDALKADGSYAVDAKSIEFWLARCTEELADASKSKWHDAARKRISILQAEQAWRTKPSGQSAVPPLDEGPPPLTDADAPH